VHPDTIASAAKNLQSKDATLLSAPVFGGNPIAAAGKLVFALGGGSPNTRQAVLPLIQDVMGRKVIDCGDDATRASLLKIAGWVLSTVVVSCLFLFFSPGCVGFKLMIYILSRNIVTVNLMEAVGEAQVFAEKTGLGTAPMEELINEAFGPVAGGYSKRFSYFLHSPSFASRNEEVRETNERSHTKGKDLLLLD
jgi:3-hydroxyisobutyrate dehydrogenase-like beta-hydroxyacid dehydrogenase